MSVGTLSHGDVALCLLPDDKVDEVETIAWQQMSIAQVFARLATSLSGLSSVEAATRLQRFGPNVFDMDDESMLGNSYAKFTFIMEIMLAFAGGLSFVNYFALNESITLEQVKDYQRIVLGAVLFLMSFMSYGFRKAQESKARKLCRSLRSVAPTLTSVFRDGVLTITDSQKLVPGDVIVLQAGECCPADVRIAQSVDLTVNTKSITGESYDKRIVEETLLLFTGTYIENGRATCAVITTGPKSHGASILTKMATGPRIEVRGSVPLRVEVEKLVKSVSFISFIVGIPLSVVAWYNGFSTQTCISIFISVMIANIPISLLPQISVSFSILAKKLQANNIFISRLDIMDTLASIDVLCVDKTGTLTEPKLEVCSLFFNSEIVKVSGSFIQERSDVMSAFLEIACLTTAVDKEIEDTEIFESSVSSGTSGTFSDDQRSLMGMRSNEIDNAIVRLIETIAPDTFSIRNYFQISQTVPFRSATRYMIKVYTKSAASETNVDTQLPPLRRLLDDSSKVQSNSQEAPTLIVGKGSPDTILRNCSKILHNGAIIPLSPELLKTIQSSNRECAQRGERVIAIALAVSNAEELSLTHCSKGGFQPNAKPLVFVGFVTFAEKLRANVVSSIRSLKRAGIQVYLLTGDNPMNSRVIASRASLLTRPTREDLATKGITGSRMLDGAVVCDGGDMMDYSPTQWNELLAADEIVFSQMLPHLKEKVILEIKRAGKIVAMLGDGVNDAPALKNAHVSIAMGSGVSIARDSSHVVLMNDDIEGICLAIEEGRKLTWNLKKSVSYLMTSNVPELLPVIAICIWSYPRALDTVSMLMAELVINVSPGICLSFEKAEDFMMLKRPEHGHFISFSTIFVSYLVGLLQTVAGYVSFFAVFEYYGFTTNDLRGAGPHFRDKASGLSPERQSFFGNLCQDHGEFFHDGECDDESFQAFRVETLNKAQAAYFLIFVVGQLANCISLRTRLRSSFEFSRVTSNSRLVLCLFCGVLLAILIVLVPTLNSCFFFDSPPSGAVARGLWIVPAVILVREAVKAGKRSRGGSQYLVQ